MTTPPTTAGWYSDPDGSGGQRYWDGATWSDHGPDTTEAATTEETSAWPSELPPWPEDMTMPSWDEAGKAEPISDVETAEADAPEPPEAEQPEAAVEGAEIDAPVTEEPGVRAEQAADIVTPVDQPSAVVIPPATPTAVDPTFPPAQPAAFAAATPPVEADPAPSNRRKWYLVGAGGLAVVLAAVLVWAFGFADSDTDTTEATGADETSEPAGTNDSATDSADPTATADGEITGVGGQVTDGDITITSKGVEITPTVAALDNEMLTKTASGEFVVVRLTMLNNGPLPATFLADQQVLTAGGQTYNTETESTFYLGGISAVLYPGEPVDVAFAYDVPPGTAPESLEVHGDLASPGAVLPLS